MSHARIRITRQIDLAEGKVQHVATIYDIGEVNEDTMLVEIEWPTTGEISECHVGPKANVTEYMAREHGGIKRCIYSALFIVLDENDDEWFVRVCQNHLAPAIRTMKNALGHPCPSRVNPLNETMGFNCEAIESLTGKVSID